MGAPIYLDNHATTQVDPRVFEVMKPFLEGQFGNPSSTGHSYGWFAKESVEIAREQVAELIGATPKEIVFTSGATESNNLAILGAARTARKGRVITLATEHSSVIASVEALRSEGFDAQVLPVEPSGLVDLDLLRSAVTDDTVLVSVMAANNEIGTLQPLSEIAGICKEVGALFHTDAAQITGKVGFDVRELGIDIASITAHKMHGPKGIGAMFVRKGRPKVRLTPVIHGGGQERGFRSGTLAPHQIAALGASAKFAKEGLLSGEPAKMAALRDRLFEIIRAVSGVTVNGAMTQRLPNNLNINVADIDGKALVLALRAVAFSSGSACSSASLKPSKVLTAIGADLSTDTASLRFGVGRFTTAAEIETAGSVFVEQVERVRGLMKG
jgi:cysteine desulfurase